MMFLRFLLTVFFVCVNGRVIAARELGIDSNRIYKLSLANSYSGAYNTHERHHLEYENYQSRTNDYDDHSSGHDGQTKSLYLRSPPVNPKNPKNTFKVHQPREDPTLFYQSDSYLEKIDGLNINHEVSFIYPGKEVIRRPKGNHIKPMSLRMQEGGINTIDSDSNICVRCPHDRTLIARAGSDRVLLQAPRLLTCNGHKPTKNVHFVHLYGPKFGSLLHQGPHMIIGKIMYKEKSIQKCKMQVHVITQGCSTPNHLTSHCKGQNCTFICRDPKSDLHGQTSLQCGSNNKWIGELPICKTRGWCMQPAPVHGRVSCKGATADGGRGLVEGSRCRLRCPRGWRNPRAVAICRHGVWTNSLKCETI